LCTNNILNLLTTKLTYCSYSFNCASIMEVLSMVHWPRRCRLSCERQMKPSPHALQQKLFMRRCMPFTCSFTWWGSLNDILQTGQTKLRRTTTRCNSSVLDRAFDRQQTQPRYEKHSLHSFNNQFQDYWCLSMLCRSNISYGLNMKMFRRFWKQIYFLTLIRYYKLL